MSNRLSRCFYLAVLLLPCAAASLAAEPPRLYHTAGLQAPVRSGPDELLLLAGYHLAPDDRVMYRDLTNDGPWPDRTALPAHPSATEGMAQVIAEASDAQALVVRLPPQLDAHRTYEIAVLDRTDAWSNAIRINDARAFWLSPSVMAASGAAPGLPRRIRIVGQNLAPDGAAPLRIRLSGPRVFELRARDARATGLAEFVAESDLPDGVPPGTYRVAVSRDANRWSKVALPFRVIAASAAPRTVSMNDARFGDCRADDDADDTRCLIAALASLEGRGGTVRFGPGTWLLDDGRATGVTPGEGILLPRGVNLAGDPRAASRIRRGDNWVRAGAQPLFVLTGDSRVTHLDFEAGFSRRGSEREAAPFLQLGRTWYRQIPVGDRVVNDITISENEFSGAEVAIADAGLALRNLTITHNRFRAWRLGLSLDGDGNNVHETFRIDDAVITSNRFEPGSYVDVAARQGTRAAEIGAGTRVDFSDNTADGISLAGLDGAGDAPGWRAAFFWHLRGPQEQLLIANNVVTCSGDKAGDGESFALDNNHNTPAFDSARVALAADRDSVTVLGPPLARAENHPIDAARYFIGHWLQVAEGPGLGQSRRVVGVDYLPDSRRTRFRVAPAWDVVPVAAASRVTVARTFWQTYIVANIVDQRRPPCTKANRTNPAGGLIALWAQSSDSIVAHNRQFDTDGIVFHQTFAAAQPSFHSFLDIRANQILGEYDRSNPKSASGIRGPHGASPDLSPPVESFGVSISGNFIDGADGPEGAGISVPLSWYDGPAPHRWPLIDRLLVFGNSIRGTRLGIEIPSKAQVHDAVLFDNHCETREAPLAVATGRATAVCAEPKAGACECAVR